MKLWIALMAIAGIGILGCQKTEIPTQSQETINILETQRASHFILRENTLRESLELLQKSIDKVSPRKIYVVTRIENDPLDPKFYSRPISLEVKNVPLIEICNFLKSLSSATYQIEENKIVFSNIVDY